LTVEYRRFSELGAKISWFRSGYLALFAVAGYELALDPAMEIVRRQILECDERHMVTFTSEAPRLMPMALAGSEIGTVPLPTTIDVPAFRDAVITLHGDVDEFIRSSECRLTQLALRDRH
jgi:hypothetical protein